jgi:pentatricopeptide repeat protein
MSSDKLSFRNRMNSGVSDSIIMFIYVIVCIFIYWNGLNGPFILDDLNSFAPLFNIDNSLEAVLLNLKRYVIELDRPLAYATFIINSLFSGESTFYWKATNLALHILTGILLLIVCEILLKDQKKSRLLAILVAGLWLIHPLQISTVLYVVQRMTILSALFVLAGLIAYAHGRILQRDGKQGIGFILLAFIVLMPLGALCKENAFLLPVYALILEIFIFNFKSGPGNKTDNFLVSMFIVAMIVGMAILLITLNTTLLQGYDIREFTLIERVMTQGRVIILYLLQVIYPIKGNLGFMHDDLVLSTSLFKPVTTITSIIILTLIALLAWYMRSRNKLFTFGIFFFFAGHLMESTILPLELMFEHRNYLPSAGIVIATIMALYNILNKSFFYPILAGISICLAVQTYHITMSWSTMPALFSYMYSAHPESKRLKNVKISLLAKEGRFSEAYYLLDSMEDQRASVKRLVVKCLENGKLEHNEIQDVSEKLNNPIHSDFVKTLSELSDMGLNKQCQYENNSIIDLIDSSLKFKIINTFEKHRLIVYRGYHFWDDKDYDKALDSFEIAHNVYPNDPLPLLMATNLAYKIGNMKRASMYLQQIYNIPEPYRINYKKDIVSFNQLIEANRNSSQ